MYTTITESYLAGSNRAVSPLAGKAEKAEKKSVKDAQGTRSGIQSESNVFIFDTYQFLSFFSLPLTF